MLLQRFLVALILGPAALLISYIGGPVYMITITTLLVIAAWECTSLFSKAGIEPATLLVIVGVLFLATHPLYTQVLQPTWVITIFILVTAGYFAFQFEQGMKRSLNNFTGTVLITLYIGWLGSYLVTLRNLSGGMWWLFLVLLIVWTTDSAAYFIGTQLGSHQLSPRLSPNKTWEGYIGGIPAGILSGVGFSVLFQGLGATVELYPWPAGVLGFILALTIPLGDLTESLIKRSAEEKDSSNLFPGHGGMLDRLDTILWAMPISTFFIQQVYPYLEKL